MHAVVAAARRRRSPGVIIGRTPPAAADGDPKISGRRSNRSLQLRAPSAIVLAAACRGSARVRLAKGHGGRTSEPAAGLEEGAALQRSHRCVSAVPFAPFVCVRARVQAACHRHLCLCQASAPVCRNRRRWRLHYLRACKRSSKRGTVFKEGFFFTYGAGEGTGTPSTLAPRASSSPDDGLIPLPARGATAPPRASLSGKAAGLPEVAIFTELYRLPSIPVRSRARPASKRRLY